VIGDILQPTHLLFILVVALLVLGPKRLPEVGRALGRGMRDFKNALSSDPLSGDDRDEVPSETGPLNTPPPTSVEYPEATAHHEPPTHHETPAPHEPPAPHESPAQHEPLYQEHHDPPGPPAEADQPSQPKPTEQAEQPEHVA
jgi:sec-independent protein translocase protein TatA